MYEASVKEFETVDIAIACAAVADYKLRYTQLKK